MHAFHDDKGFPGPDSQGEIQSPGIDINLPRYRSPGRSRPPNRRDNGMNGARRGQHERSFAAAPGGGAGMSLAAAP